MREELERQRIEAEREAKPVREEAERLRQEAEHAKVAAACEAERINQIRELALRRVEENAQRGEPPRGLGIDPTLDAALSVSPLWHILRPFLTSEAPTTEGLINPPKNT